MLLKLLQDGFGSAMDLNCAEKILYGANWAYNMKLPCEALKLAAGFGGGKTNCTGFHDITEKNSRS